MWSGVDNKIYGIVIFLIYIVYINNNNYMYVILNMLL